MPMWITTTASAGRGRGPVTCAPQSQPAAGALVASSRMARRTSSPSYWRHAASLRDVGEAYPAMARPWNVVLMNARVRGLATTSWYSKCVLGTRATGAVVAVGPTPGWCTVHTSARIRAHRPQCGVRERVEPPPRASQAVGPVAHQLLQVSELVRSPSPPRRSGRATGSGSAARSFVVCVWLLDCVRFVGHVSFFFRGRAP
jgi:hypothetical protein